MAVQRFSLNEADHRRTLKRGGAAQTVSLDVAGAGLTEGALKVAVHRLRRQYLESLRSLRSQIGETLHHPAEVESKIRYLMEVQGRSS